MRVGHELVYLSSADVAALDLAPSEVAAAVEAMLREKAAGRARTKPKLGLYPMPGTFYQAMAGALAEPAYAAVKWTGVVHDNDSRGLPHVSPLIVLNELATGAPVAVMDGRWVTAQRTAALTLAGAKRLARADSSTVAFVGCGVQARSHLALLRAAFPIARVTAHGRRRETAERFAREALSLGLAAEVATDPRAAVEDALMVVSSVPESPGLEPFLDPGWLKPGAFVGAIDVGRSWRLAGMLAFDIVATDDREQSTAMVKSGRLVYSGPFHADLAELVSGRHPGRRAAEERTALIYSGLALADVAVAAAIYERARRKGIGTVVPL